MEITTKIIRYLNDLGLFRFISDEKFIKNRYKKVFNKDIDLVNPETFNEKLNWLKLNDRKEIYTTMVDKYEAKKYVSKIIGKEYIVPTLGVWDRFDDIDFKKLPNEFILKCTHDSGGLVICKDKNKLNTKKTKTHFNLIMRRNYYYRGREWPYKNVKPRIIAEVLLKNKKNDSIQDYKFFCFNGKAKFFKIDFNRFVKHQANYYDVNGTLLEFGEEICPPDFEKKIELPKNLSKMIKLAEKLAENIPFLRVDFYEVDDKVYFGELTFFPASGFGKFTPESWDMNIGKYLDLGKENK